MKGCGNLYICDELFLKIYIYIYRFSPNFGLTTKGIVLSSGAEFPLYKVILNVRSKDYPRSFRVSIERFIHLIKLPHVCAKAEILDLTYYGF